MFGEANAIGGMLEFGLDEREAAIEGMILIDLRTEVGSKKTGPDTVSLVVGMWRTYRTGSFVLIAVRHNVCDRRSLQITI